MTRFRGPADLADELLALADLLRARAGCVEVLVGRNVDDPQLWTLNSRWVDVGSYRRALGSHEVKLHGTPVLLKALDEPGAYEVVGAHTPLNHAQARGSDGDWLG